MALSTGCGKSLSKLDDNQKSTLKKSINGASDSFEALPSTQGSGSSLMGIMQSALMGSPGEGSSEEASGVTITPSTPTSPVVSEDSSSNRAQMRRLLQGKLKGGECNHQFSQSTRGAESPDLGSGNFALPSMKISGERCPILVEMKHSRSANSMKFNLSYKVLDQDFMKVSEVDEMSLDLQTSVSSTGASGDFSGKFRGKNIGSISISGKFSASSGGMEGSVRFDLPDFSAEFGMKSEGAVGAAGTEGSEMLYTLNGEKLSPTEIEEYFGKNLSGALTKGRHRGSRPTNPSGSDPVPAPFSF